MAISTSIVCLCVTVLPLHFVYATTTYDYTCHPNNTIVVTGLPTNFTSMNYYAYQESDRRNCTATGVQNTGVAVITGCDKEEAIIFTFGTYSDMLTYGIQGGKQVDIVNITCLQINEDGVADTIAANITAILDFEEHRSFNVTYDVTSDLNPTTASIGDSVIWTITYPSDYSIEIQSCAAYAGTSTTGPNSIALISTWCSSETELISNFGSPSGGQATATIKAFKFYGEDSVYLTCSLLVCPSTNGSCTTSCGSGRKRRRSGDGRTGVYEKRVSKVLHIIDTQSSASKLGLGFAQTFLLTYLVLKF